MSSPVPLRRWAVAAGLAGFVIALAGIPARATYGAQVSGDEPYYLLTALSLANDGDLDIADELAAGAYRTFHEVDINPQTVPLDHSGREVSPHDPLLALLLAGPVALGGWVAAKITLAGVAAATAAATVWFAVHRMTVPPAVAGPVVIAGFAGLPLAGYGTQVYPEMPAALTLLAGVSAVTSPRFGHYRVAAMSVAAVVALPWWSVKYVPVAAVVGTVLLWRSRRRRTVAVLVAGVAMMAGIAYLAAHQWIYGGWTAYAAGDHFVDTGEFGVMGTRVDLVGRARRLTGLLVDRQFGLVIWSPVWILLPPALARAVRLRPSLATSVSLGVIAAGWLNASFVALTMHGWWLPGRQLVVVLPVALAIVAAWVADGHRRLLALGALGGIGLVNWLWLAVEASTGRRTLIVDFAETAAVPVRLLAPLFPDGIRHSVLDTALLIGWTVVLMALCWPPRRRPGGRIVRSLSAPRLVSKNSS